MVTIHEAIDIVLASVNPLPSEEAPLLHAFGRSAAADEVSAEPVPPFDNSAMDGYAVRAEEVAAGRRRFRVVVEVPAGRWVDREIGAGEAARIMTGAPLPPGLDAVVPFEVVEEDGDAVTLSADVRSGANVRRAGESVAAGDTVFLRGTVLGPAEIALLAAVGRSTIPVMRRPRVAIIATGSELVPVGRPLSPGRIHDSNSYGSYGQVLAAGGEPVLLGIVGDDPSETRRLLSRALAYDVVLTSGGVSVGKFDFVKEALGDLGVDLRFWGVAMRPGKHLAFGVHGRTLVFGLPGNPMAAMVGVEVFVRPALLAMQSRVGIFRPVVTAVAVESVKGTAACTELRRCRLMRGDEGWSFGTTGPQGSPAPRSMASAQGLAIVPPGYPGGEAGERLSVMLLEGSAEERPPFPE